MGDPKPPEADPSAEETVGTDVAVDIVDATGAEATENG